MNTKALSKEMVAPENIHTPGILDFRSLGVS